MNGKKWTRAVLVTAVGVTLGVAVARPATGSGGNETGVRDEGPAWVTETGAPSPSVTRSGSATPGVGATFADGSQDAERTTGWAVIRPGTPAARYWARHGVSAEDPYHRCEAAIRAQFIRGYVEPAETQQPLWKFECGGVSDADRDSITLAAVQWGSDHPEGDG